jgi:[ribosomal protein S5]-alanine N-acetyltransferase
MNKIEILSERLVIRDHIIEDILEYHELISDKNNMFFIQDLMSHSIEETKNILQKIIDDSNNYDRKKYFWGVFLKDKTYIGEIGYTVASTDNTGKSRVNLGYFIKKDFWNQGFTSEALKAVIDFAFNKNEVQKIELGCLVDNIASEKVMVKCGFKREAYKINHTWLNNKWMDRVEYGMLRD